MGLPMPAGAVLISPWVDLTHSFPSVLENVDTVSHLAAFATIILQLTSRQGHHSSTRFHGQTVNTLAC
jgi:acetyl esterase/lipase